MSEEDNYLEVSTQRIEAFSDGVFAIAITLLILEIKVPHLVGTDKSLASGLLDLWSSYFGYVSSFIMIGIYWVNHHYVFQLYKRTDHYFLILNVLFLMCISFVPFTTSVLAEYLTDPKHFQTAIIFYNFGFLLCAFTWLLIWLYSKRNNLIDEKLSPLFVSKITKIYVLSNLLYLMATLVSIWNAIAGLFICVALSFLYLRKPPRPIIKETENNND